MKKLWIILLILVIIIAIILLLFLMNKKKIKENNLDIKYMRFSYSTSTMMYGNVSYEINYKDNKYIASIKPNNKSEEEKLEIELDNKTLNNVIDVLNKYDINSWDKFSKHDKNVLDGNGFSFSLRTKDGKEITASGYMKWPTNYSEVRSGLDDIFNNLYEENYIEDLTYLYLIYTNGYEANSETIYRIKKDNDKYILNVKNYGEEEEKTITVDEDFIRKVEVILNKYNVSSWNGFKKHDTNVLDGDSFNFDAEFKNKKIEANGYELWPNNFVKVKEELTKLIENLT